MVIPNTLIWLTVWLAMTTLHHKVGWQVAWLYLIAGMIVATLAGMIIGRLQPEHQFEDFVWQIRGGDSATALTNLTWHQRFYGSGKQS